MLPRFTRTWPGPILDARLAGLAQKLADDVAAYKKKDEQNLAEGVDEKAIDVLQNFVNHIHVRAVGGVGVLGLIITSGTLMNSADRAIQRVWQTPSRALLLRIASFELRRRLRMIFLCLHLRSRMRRSIPTTQRVMATRRSQYWY